jgi:serine/threonine-protein kinase
VAFQKPLGREVALKLISGVEMNEAALARFEREARAIAALDHPMVVKLHDYGVAEIGFRVPYMALEYVRNGRTLRRVLAEERTLHSGVLPGEVVISVFRQILFALSAAHKLGIIHRDMKPDNVMVTAVEGNPWFVKVLDFGLAKAVSEVSGFDAEISHTGQVLGTPIYMAPEQAWSSGQRTVDGRTDLYAVAVMLFEVFAGTRPFDGASAMEILQQKNDPSVRPLDNPACRGLDPALRAFLGRGLAKRIEDRFATADEMLKAFLEAFPGGPITTSASPGSGPPPSDSGRPATPTALPAGSVVQDTTESMGGGKKVSASPAPGLAALDPVASPEVRRTLVLPGAASRGRILWLVAVGLLAASVGGLAAVMFVGGVPQGTQTLMSLDSDPGATADVEPATMPRVAPVRAPETVPATRLVLVESVPVNAELVVDGRVAGWTPRRIEIREPPPEGPDPEMVFEVRAAGYARAASRMKASEAIRAGRLLLELVGDTPPVPATRPTGPKRGKFKLL